MLLSQGSIFSGLNVYLNKSKILLGSFYIRPNIIIIPLIKLVIIHSILHIQGFQRKGKRCPSALGKEDHESFLEVLRKLNNSVAVYGMRVFNPLSQTFIKYTLFFPGFQLCPKESNILQLISSEFKFSVLSQNV